MRHLIVFTLLVLSPIVSISQEITGNPFIRNFKPQEYNAHVQNWDIEVDGRGIIYIANGDGLLEYDGIDWRIYELPNQVTARSVEIDSLGRIFAAGVGDFGLFTPDSIGNLKYTSLLPLVDSQYHNFTDVWDIHIIGKSVFFRANEYLFKYRDNSVVVFKPDNIFNGGFTFKDRYFIQDKGHDLHEIIGDSIARLDYPRYPLDKRLYDAASYPGNRKLLLFADGLYLFNPESREHPIQPFNTELDEYIEKNLGYSLNRINGNEYAIGTQLDGGFVVIDEEGKEIQKVNKLKGLQQGSVYAMTTDKQKNFWLAMSNGISMAEIGTPVTFWNDQNGLNGTVEDVIKFKGTYYVATHQGIFYLEGSRAYRIKGAETQCWAFLHFKVPDKNIDKLLFTAHTGLFEIKNKKLSKICWDDNIYSIIQSKFDEDKIVLGLENGLMVLEYESGTWSKCKPIKGLDAEIRSIYEISPGVFWLTTFRNGAIKVSLTPNEKAVNSLKWYKKEQGFKTLKNVLVYPFRNKPVFFSNKGIYRYNEGSDVFEVDTTFGENINEETRGIYAFHENKNGDYIFSGLNNEKNAIAMARKQESGEFLRINKPFRRIPEMMVLELYLDEEGCVWIGGSTGLYKYNPDKKESFSGRSHAQIRKVVLNEDSLIFNGNYFVTDDSVKHITTSQNIRFIPEISYRNNSITFHFTSNSYIDADNNEYSCYLEGFDEGWSEWRKINTKQYTNLSKGSYVFHVKGRNIYNEITEEDVYKFKILPPWYLTIWAYIGYFIIGFLLIYLILKIYTLRLRAANIRLEELVQKRTKEIETKKEEILSQSEQLTKTNQELEKLSIVARETDNAILIVDPKGSIEWINEGFTRLFGYTLDDLKKTGTDIFKLSEKSDISSKFQYCVENKESVIYETYNTTKDGRSIWTQTTLTPILDNEGEIYKLIAIDSDINKLKEAEEEIKKQKEYIEEQNAELEKHRHQLENLVEQRTEDLKEAKEKAEQSDRLKSAFLANMSHEIRTPMNAIIGFTNMLNDPDMDESVRKDLMNQITYSSYSLLNLIDNIIDLAKVDSNQIEINKKDIEVNEVMNSIYESFDENIISKNLEFSLNLPEDILTIKTDDYRLKQIFRNLLENAVKFTEKGYIKIGYRLPENSNEVLFYVKDSGIGIPRDKLESIFQRFTKLEDNRQRLYRGAGLGLSLNKILVEKLGGKIWADSRVHEGSDFYFTIPRS